jgi:hypothetical protein
MESRAYQKQVKENIKAITKQTDRYWELIKEPKLKRQDTRNEGEKQNLVLPSKNLPSSKAKSDSSR